MFFQQYLTTAPTATSRDSFGARKIVPCILPVHLISLRVTNFCGEVRKTVYVETIRTHARARAHAVSAIHKQNLPSVFSTMLTRCQTLLKVEENHHEQLL